LETIFISEEHTRDFNFPYQIGPFGDPPELSLENKHEIKENDILVIGTDGFKIIFFYFLTKINKFFSVFDNLYENQMIDFLKNYIEKDGTFQDIKEVNKKFGKFIFDMSVNP